MSVKLGINPLTWTNDDLPSLGGDTPLATCLTEGKQAGFAGFELGHKFPRDPELLKPILQRHELELVSGWYSGYLLERSVEEEIEAVQSHLQLLKAMGCKVMVFCEVTGCVHGDQGKPVSERPPFPAERWEEYGARLTEFARYTLSQGVQLAYHHHMGTVIETEAEVDALMQHTGPELGLLLDTGHMTYAGGDPVEVAKRWARRINHVHCKDIRANILKEARNRNSSFLNAVLDGAFTVPGDGCVDYPAVFKVLKDNDYQGWLVVEAEQDPSVAHPLTYATLGHNNLHAFARNAGLL
ncbi:myo-inosose-2 dehydratase [Zobellella iuensis]|uniref:Myo-inosose-2 dehydratase n=1 Tax=Zobellella iuensis TaxID=2803811 RepID=A0ABS1QTF8_9GAMM|nr:myo-inosose-2 dehydratase [Zobellella iuensis]MBL1378159.1 myo-inosose-2 dehydratase [Zobellella iuensis]